MVPLESAVVHRHPELVELLVMRGADVNYRDRSGNTLLMLAVAYDRIISDSSLNIIPTLVRNKVDVNAKNDNGFTALTMLLQVGDQSHPGFLGLVKLLENEAKKVS